MKEAITILKENFICDLRKKEINKKERATIIKDIIKEKKLSIRSFATTYGFNYSTVEDWLLWDKVTEKQVVDLKKKGLNDTNIYKMLRNNRHTKIKELTSKSEIDYKIIDLTYLLNKKGPVKYNNQTKELLEDLIKKANYVIFKIDKNRK